MSNVDWDRAERMFYARLVALVIVAIVVALFTAEHEARRVELERARIDAEHPAAWRR